MFEMNGRMHWIYWSGMYDIPREVIFGCFKSRLTIVLLDGCSDHTSLRFNSVVNSCNILSRYDCFLNIFLMTDHLFLLCSLERVTATEDHNLLANVRRKKEFKRQMERMSSEYEKIMTRISFGSIFVEIIGSDPGHSRDLKVQSAEPFL
jgi:hypothetical protein